MIKVDFLLKLFIWINDGQIRKIFTKKANGSEWNFSKHNSVLYDDIVNLMYIERHNLRGQLLDIKCTIVQMEKLI